MRANPAHIPSGELARPASAQVAQGGPVAEWHRAIEDRYVTGHSMPDEHAQGERIIRYCSRMAGYGALVAGYVLVGHMVARWVA